MAKITRITKRGSRSVTLAVGNLIGMHGHEFDGVRINFGCDCDEIDPRYAYNVVLSRKEIIRLAAVSIKGSELNSNLTPEEAAEWLRLSKKAMTKQPER